MLSNEIDPKLCTKSFVITQQIFNLITEKKCRTNSITKKKNKLPFQSAIKRKAVLILESFFIYRHRKYLRI